MEEIGAGGDEADRSGETRQSDDGCQNELTRLAEQAQHVGVDDGAAVADVSRHARSGITQLEQGDIHHGQTHGRDQAGDGQILELTLIVIDALLAQQIHDQRTEHQGSQGIHGVVAF